MFGGHQRQQAARQGGHRVRQARRGLQLTEANWMAVMGDRGVDALWGSDRRPPRSLPDWASRPSPTSPPPTRRCSPRRSGRRPACGSCCWPRAAATPTSAPNRGWPARAATSSPSPTISPTAPRSRRPCVDLARRTLDEVGAAGAGVTRVAVTVRTKTFYTSTKIRKLADGGQRSAGLDHDDGAGAARPVRAGPYRPVARRAAGAGAARRGGTESDPGNTARTHAAHGRDARIPLAARGGAAAASASPSSPAPTAAGSRRCTERCACSPTAGAAR